MDEAPEKFTAEEKVAVEDIVSQIKAYGRKKGVKGYYGLTEETLYDHCSNAMLQAIDEWRRKEIVAMRTSMAKQYSDLDNDTLVELLRAQPEKIQGTCEIYDSVAKSLVWNNPEFDYEDFGDIVIGAELRLSFERCCVWYGVSGYYHNRYENSKIFSNEASRFSGTEKDRSRAITP